VCDFSIGAPNIDVVVTLSHMLAERIDGSEIYVISQLRDALENAPSYDQLSALPNTFLTRVSSAVRLRRSTMQGNLEVYS
jgi:hypothetical protein